MPVPPAPRPTRRQRLRLWLSLFPLFPLPQILARRLYVRIWLAIVVTVAVLTLLFGGLWRMQAEHERAQRPGREIVLKNANGEVVGQALARPIRVPGQGVEFEVPLTDGSTLFVHLPRPSRPPYLPSPAWWQTPLGFIWLLVLVAVAVAVGTYPVVRRLTKRLEALQRGVEQWGDGDLSHRLPQQGNDEVGSFAARFNLAAERVETLMKSHKSLLANASHELRSPLARIRMGLELMDGGAPATARRAEIERSIAELDELIGEILLASRLDSPATDVGALETLDLTGLVAEECAQAGASLDAQSVSVQGVPKLLRRMVRNLLENARRYSAGAVEVGLACQGSTATLRVVDQGPGVPPDQRERIFEPFYRLPGASERDGGVGLGLALVRSIARRHGGTVRCEGSGSVDGRGACFVVSLPLAAVGS